MSALCLGHQDFVTLIACISIQHPPGAQCKRKSNLIERCSSMQRGEGKEGVSKHAAGVLELTVGREQRNPHTVHR